MWASRFRLRRRGAPAMVIAMTAAALLAYAPSAYASTAYSPYGYYGPFLGYEYYNQSYVSNDYGQLVARSSANVYSGGNGEAPTGYMGVLPRLFKGSALCAQPSNYSYNPSPAVGYDVPVYAYCGSGSYSSYGVTKAYNGNGYNAYFTFQSPNIND